MPNLASYAGLRRPSEASAVSSSIIPEEAAVSPTGGSALAHHHSGSASLLTALAAAVASRTNNHQADLAKTPTKLDELDAQQRNHKKSVTFHVPDQLDLLYEAEPRTPTQTSPLPHDEHIVPLEKRFVLLFL